MIEVKNVNHDKFHIISKKWGKEIILHNDKNYCGKILSFHKGGQFSLHFHIEKRETFYINKGMFEFTYIDTTNASKHKIILAPGDVIEITPGLPHQICAIQEGEIFEVSTPHYDDDSYRIEKGDSQC